MPGFSKTQVAGLLIAAGAGAATALLLAPKSGAETRQDISRISKKAASQVAGQVKGQLSGLQCGLKDQITGGYQQVKKIIRIA